MNNALIDEGPSRKYISQEVLGSRMLIWRQRRVALFTVGIPALAVVFAIWYSIAVGVPSFFLYLWLVMHFVSITGVSIGFHRYGSHKSFKANVFVRGMFMIFGSMSAQGPIIYWATNHRRHHHKTDRSGDVHSPFVAQDGEAFHSRLNGFWQAHTGWMFRSRPSNPVRYSRDLLKDKVVIFVNRYYYYWVFLGILLPGLISLAFYPTWKGFWLGVFYGGLARLFTVQHCSWLVNSFTHMVGKRPFHTGDGSRNSFWLGFLASGEGWHNNHHAFPYSAKLGLKWWQIDPGYYVLYVLKLLGLVSGIRTPSNKEQELKRQNNILVHD